MDSNENNKDSDSVPNLGSSELKPDLQEELEDNVENDKDTIYSKLKKINAFFEKKLKDLGQRKEELGQKRKKSENSETDVEKDSIDFSNDSVKRRRYCDIKNSRNSMFSLLVTNLPGEWSSEQIMDYLKDDCDVNISRINDSREENTETDFQIRLQFQTKEQLERVLKKLKDKEDDGKLKVQIDDIKNELESDADSDTTLQLENLEEASDSKQVDSSAGTSKPDADLNLDSNDYHIRKDYLSSLGIEPPITNRVIVTDFRCDKSELKEVLEVAGKVLICSVCTVSKKYANVTYSHPLEAVQAVSMLNGQKLYGKVLKVTMSNAAVNKTMLPKGLLDVGPGLGKYGKPLPDLPEQYKRFLKGKTSNIEACIFQQSLLKKIGVTVDEEMFKFVRAINTTNKNEVTDKERSESPTDNQNQGPQLGPVGQKITNPVNNIPVVRSQNYNRLITNNMGPRIVPMPVPSPMQSPIRGPMQSPIRDPMQSPIRGPMQTPIRDPMQSPIRGPMQSPILGPVMGPRVPLPPRPIGSGFTIPNPHFPSCPPIPGVESGSDPKVLNGMMSGPRPMIRAPGPMGPRGPMVGPNRFPGPGSPMMGPRPVGPVPQRPITTLNGPMRPNHQFGSGVRMFKGPDPVLIQMTNLPPTTNFVNLGQKLSELGHVVFLELTTPGCANVRFATPADADRCLPSDRCIY